MKIAKRKVTGEPISAMYSWGSVTPPGHVSEVYKKNAPSGFFSYGYIHEYNPVKEYQFLIYDNLKDILAKDGIMVSDWELWPHYYYDSSSDGIYKSVGR